MFSQYIILPKGLSYSSVFSVKPEPVTTLWFMLAEIPDPRRGQGRRHPLSVILTLAILALCSGHLSYLAMQELCENYQEELEQQVPFLAGHMPNSATFHRVFSRLDEKAVEDVLAAWIQTVIPLEKGEGIALDGKTIHGTGIHLIAAFAHIAKSVLFEMGTTTKGKELVIGPKVIKHISVKDRVVTGDALFAQKTFCNLITKRKGGYVFRVKGNQDTMEKDIRFFFNDVPFGATVSSHTTIDRWKGRIEKRIVRVSPDLTAYLSWPGLTHIWSMEKTVTAKNKEGNIETTTEVSVGIARIPEELLGTLPIEEKVSDAIRGHWSIEIRAHRTRDSVFKEDNATIRVGHAPQVMAALRNLVTSIFHKGTVRSFPTAMRRFAAKPDELFDFLGLTGVTKTAVLA